MLMHTRERQPMISHHRSHFVLRVVVFMLAVAGAVSTYPTTRTMSPSFTIHTTTTTTTTAATTTTRDPMEFRLPTDLVPFHYDLTLQPNIYNDDPKTFTFNGSVVIHVTCKNTTDKIVLNSRQLSYDNRSMILIHDEDGSRRNSASVLVPKIASYTFDLKREFLILHLDSNLVVGRNYSVGLRFWGPLKDELKGLYLSSYEMGNRTVYLATSSLEPTHARKVFPCFDEPAIKATFTTSLIRKSHMTSLSNMERVTETPITNGWVKDTYNRTVRMSTYLLAFVVCDFTSASVRIERDDINVLVTVWTRPECIAQADYALDAAVRLLLILQKYMGIPYPLNKLDMVAVPDFAGGGMENWGLITYMEAIVFYDPNVSSIHEKMQATELIAHEIAHMWYGNYVTPSWWDDLWLKEGFAVFMAIMAVDKFQPTWHYMDRFRIEITETALKTDALKSSHPLYVPLYDGNHATDVFDSISYRKGAHVIKMMQSFVNFRAGLRRYLQAHAYGHATHNDLWKAMSAVTPGVNVSRVMATWVNQMNFPLVTLTRTYNDPSDTGTQLTVRQERYLRVKDEPESTEYISDFGYKWIIPVNMITRDNASHVIRTWLEDEYSIKEFVIPNKLGTKDWVLGNADNHVFCRVNYDLDNWRLISQQLKQDHTVIPLTDRLTLIYDACALARAGYISIAICLDIASYFDHETEYLPLKAATDAITDTYDKLLHTTVHRNFSKWMRPKVASIYSSLPPLDNITDVYEQLKASFVSTVACYYGNGKCLKEMRDEFKKHMAISLAIPIQNYRINPNLIADVLCYGIEQGTRDDWRRVYGMLGNGTVPDRSALITALGCSKDPEILNEYMNKSLTEMSPNDVYVVVEAVTNSRYGGKSVAFNFFRDNVHRYFEKLGKMMYVLGDILKQICKTLHTRALLAQFDNLVTSLPDPSIVAPAIEEVRGTIKTNIAWMDTNEKVVAHWLKSRIDSA